MDTIKQAVDAWLALAKHLIPEDDIRSQFIGWLAQAIDPEAHPPKQISGLRTRQGAGKTLLLAPIISAGAAVRRDVYDNRTNRYAGPPAPDLPPSAVIEEFPTAGIEALLAIKRLASEHRGRAMVLSNSVNLSGEPLDATGNYWVYDSRAEPLSKAFYAGYLEKMANAHGGEKEIIAGIKASLA